MGLICLKVLFQLNAIICAQSSRFVNIRPFWQFLCVRSSFIYLHISYRLNGRQCVGDFKILGKKQFTVETTLIFLITSIYRIQCTYHDATSSYIFSYVQNVAFLILLRPNDTIYQTAICWFRYLTIIFNEQFLLSKRKKRVF